MRDDQHHAEQQRDRAEIDRAIGLVERQRAAGDHQRRAQERRAGAVQPQEGQSAEGDDQVGRGEN